MRNRIIVLCAPIAVVVLCGLMMVLAACGGGGGSVTPPGSGPDATSPDAVNSDASTTTLNLSGNWAVTIKVTAASGVCAGDESDPAETTTIVIQQSGNTVTASGFLGDATKVLTGTLSGTTLTLSGSYSEDGGTTTSTHVLTVDANDPTKLSGTESWSWSGAGGTCPNGKASVTATKL